MSAAVEQLFISGLSQGFGNEGDAGLVRAYLPDSPNLVKEQASQHHLETPNSSNGDADKISKIGFIGLGAMGRGMAASLVRAGFIVQGYDVHAPAVQAFAQIGPDALPTASPSEAIRGADVVLLMVQNANQIDDVLFGSGCGADTLSDNAVVIVSSTVPPEYVRTVNLKLKELGKSIVLVDAPVSGGVARAANGTLTVCTLKTLIYNRNSDHANILPDYMFWRSHGPFQSSLCINSNDWRREEFMSCRGRHRHGLLCETRQPAPRRCSYCCRR